ncbi:MAG TPA: hypothetical protein VK116_20035, partial [Planctomycetota bacterium]|nr:hypothetical protein [Planctomycetota bacterium]
MRTISSSVRALALLLNVGFASTLGAPLLGQGAGELLPDLIVDLEALRDWEVVENPFNGRAELRFSTSTPNIGAGPLVIRGVFPPNDDGTQNVVQRIFRAGGGFTERDAGAFVFHSDHDHIHLEDWTAYRLRRVLGDGSPGEVIAESTKTSFCLADFEVYD